MVMSQPRSGNLPALDGPEDGLGRVRKQIGSRVVRPFSRVLP
jgi:hypothetical protein